MKVTVTQHEGKMEKMIKIRTEQGRCISIIMEQETTHNQRHSTNC